MATPYPSMTPAAQDALQVLIVKAAYYAQAAVEAAGGPSMPGFFPNMSPFAQDPLQVAAAKLAYWLSQLSGGGGGVTTAGTTNLALAGLAPPTDGSVPTFRAFDTDTGFEWYNSGTIAAPVWHNV